MKYQSELIKEIVDKSGHNKSAIHYQSECIDQWIEENKGAYPKLCDYESEWLYYVNEKPIGNFPCETITDVTEATVNNVVPYAYRRAILKGRTLVNLAPQVEDTVIRDHYQGEYVMLTPHITPLSNLKPNTKYTVIFKASNITNAIEGIFYYQGADTDYFYFSENMGNYTLVNGHNKLLFTTETEVSRIQFSVYSTLAYGGSFTIHGDSIMLLEGDHTQEDIVYFEGMQSVKMPVLTTTGKNLFDGGIERGSFDDGVPRPAEEGWQEYIRSKNFTKVKSLDFYTSINTGLVTNIDRVRIHCYDENYEYISTKAITEQKPTNTKYIKITAQTLNNPADLSLNYNIQIEESSVATSYESFKSNILTVNEDVTLRSNENICDELNLLTGQLTQRIGEDGVVLSQEVVKTVDLTCINEQGESVSFKPIEGTMHIMTNGTPIKPTVTIEVPVEAITQNLMSFENILEGE